MEMSVGALDHYNVSTRKLKETVQFYEEILGFVNGPRPQFNFPGPGCIVRVMPFCTSMAQRTASTTLLNSMMLPSPVRLTTRP